MTLLVKDKSIVHSNDGNVYFVGQEEAAEFAAKILSKVTDLIPKHKSNKKANSKDVKSDPKEVDQETDAIARRIKKKDLKTCQEELFKQRYNIREMLLGSNATPIRKYDIGFVCCFCTNQYELPADLKKHTIDDHDDNTKLNFMKGQFISQFLIKLDVTALMCKLCDTNLDDVKSLIKHLKDDHAKPMFTDIKNYILAFKFEGTENKCTVCSQTFNRFKVLQEHMYSHYRNYVCGVCDMGFLNERMLTLHSERHKTGTFKCGHCPETFDAPRKKKYHEKKVHTPSFYKCGFCDEKFSWYSQKCTHI